MTKYRATLVNGRVEEGECAVIKWTFAMIMFFDDTDENSLPSFIVPIKMVRYIRRVKSEG